MIREYQSVMEQNGSPWDEQSGNPLAAPSMCSLASPSVLNHESELNGHSELNELAQDSVWSVTWQDSVQKRGDGELRNGMWSAGKGGRCAHDHSRQACRRRRRSSRSRRGRG